MPDPSPWGRGWGGEERKKKKESKSNPNHHFAEFSDRLGLENVYNLYTKGSQVVCATANSAPWGEKKPKTKKACHIRAKVLMLRALVWEKILMQVFETLWVFTHMSKVMQLS